MSCPEGQCPGFQRSRKLTLAVAFRISSDRPPLVLSMVRQCPGQNTNLMPRVLRSYTKLFRVPILRSSWQKYHE